MYDKSSSPVEQDKGLTISGTNFLGMNSVRQQKVGVSLRQ